MDFNAVSAEPKGYGTQAVPVVEQEDRVKPQVTPVQADSGASKSKLDERSLHGGHDERGAAKVAGLSREELEEAVKKVQGRLDAIGANLSVGLKENREVEKIIVQVRDKSSQEVVRQFPSEELITLQAKLDDLIGILFDKKA